jgi:acyl carrier protein
MEFDDDKLKDVFVSTLGLSADAFDGRLRLGDVAEWDSLSHFDLICAIESAFQIRFSTKEIEEVLSVDKIRETMRKK